MDTNQYFKVLRWRIYQDLIPAKRRRGNGEGSDPVKIESTSNNVLGGVRRSSVGKLGYSYNTGLLTKIFRLDEYSEETNLETPRYSNNSIPFLKDYTTFPIKY